MELLPLERICLTALENTQYGCLWHVRATAGTQIISPKRFNSAFMKSLESMESRRIQKRSGQNSI